MNNYCWRNVHIHTMLLKNIKPKKWTNCTFSTNCKLFMCHVTSHFSAFPDKIHFDWTKSEKISNMVAPSTDYFRYSGPWFPASVYFSWMHNIIIDLHILLLLISFSLVVLCCQSFSCIDSLLIFQLWSGIKIHTYLLAAFRISGDGGDDRGRPDKGQFGGRGGRTGQPYLPHHLRSGHLLLPEKVFGQIFGHEAPQEESGRHAQQCSLFGHREGREWIACPNPTPGQDRVVEEGLDTRPLIDIRVRDPAR